MSHPLRPIPTVPHEDDCLDTYCPACGCCCHCIDEDHCPGTEQCAGWDCGCAAKDES